MATTMHQDVVNGQVVWWQPSCRTEFDWYAITYGGTILADHLHSKEAAEAAAREVLARARESGMQLPG
ncbi:hypothetical protein [Burkholderia ubonensis]|uniref:hypothetical protein n=1 Tax=Burkholderia ubonensis TaxID=101571 RepID=UPI000A4160B8|nr:hypothetical protein [Burkholderia ubonensis]